MNKIVTRGTPRTTSMNKIENSLTTGREERRPSASSTPMGKDSTMPPTESSRVISSPPHTVVSTLGSRLESGKSRQDHQRDQQQRNQPQRRHIAPVDRPQSPDPEPQVDQEWVDQHEDPDGQRDGGCFQRKNRQDGQQDAQEDGKCPHVLLPHPPAHAHQEGDRSAG